MVDGLREGMQEVLYDDLAGKPDETDMVLIEKLKPLAYSQEVALFGFLEKHRA